MNSAKLADLNPDLIRTPHRLEVEMTLRTLERKDLLIGTVIATLMAILFVSLGGKPLIVTFIPGLVVSWLIYLWMYLRRIRLPDGNAFFPIYFATIAWQFIHFAEEYLTGFYDRFPSLYGASSFRRSYLSVSI